MFSSFWKLFGYGSQTTQTNSLPQASTLNAPERRDEAPHPKPIQKQLSVKAINYVSNFEDDFTALSSKQELQSKGMLLMSHLGENSFGKVIFSLPG